MITVKVRYGKDTSLISRVSDLEHISLAYSKMLNEGYIGLIKKCIPERIEIHTPREVNQRVTFYDSGHKMTEFVLPANSGVDRLETVYDQVKSFYEYAKTVESIDVL